jgi:hypothetical protein
MLEEVPVITCHLDDVGFFVKSPMLLHIHAVFSGMFHPTVGERRKIGVLGENVLGGYEFINLSQKAFVTNKGMERVKWLHLRVVFPGDVTFAQR